MFKVNNKDKCFLGMFLFEQINVSWEPLSCVNNIN